MSEQELMCYCFEVPKADIIKIIQEKNAYTVDDIQEHCDAGLGCGGCRFDMEELLEEIAPSPPICRKKSSNEHS